MADIIDFLKTAKSPDKPIMKPQNSPPFPPHFDISTSLQKSGKKPKSLPPKKKDKTNIKLGSEPLKKKDHRNTYLIDFYNGIALANRKQGYLYDDIVFKWDDKKLDSEQDYIQFLFPLKTKSKNKNAPLLKPQDIKKFKKDPQLRKKVILATIRMLNLYGYDENIEPIESKKQLGLYSEHNYPRITRIMKFLHLIDLPLASMYFFIAICDALNRDKNLVKKVIKNGSLSDWIDTQPFLKKYKDRSMDKFMKIFRQRFKSEIDKTELEKACSMEIRGLDYISNSCYQDSTLLCLLGISNQFITTQILEKNLSESSYQCEDKNETESLKRRKNVQVQIKYITESMRGLNTINYCSGLRQALAKCPGTQEFHLGGTQSAGEFLQHLFNIFQVNGMSATEIRSYSNDKINWFHENIKHLDSNQGSPILHIHPITIKSIPENTFLHRFISYTSTSTLDDNNLWYPDKKNKPNEHYKYRKLKNVINDTPYLVIYLQRLHAKDIFGLETEFLDKQIIPNETLTINKKRLYLTGIVVHDRYAHYMAYFKCSDKWFFYNDEPGRLEGHTITYVGDYQNLLNVDRYNPLVYGVLFFYS